MIRQATWADHARCAEIQTAAWNLAIPSHTRVVSLAEFRAQTQGEQIDLVVAQGKIAGFISVWEPDWFVHHLYVDPQAQGSGLGARLIALVAERAGEQGLSLKCLVENKGAMSFYRGLGFALTDEVGTDRFGPWVRLTRTAT